MVPSIEGNAFGLGDSGLSIVKNREASAADLNEIRRPAARSQVECGRALHEDDLCGGAPRTKNKTGCTEGGWRAKSKHDKT